jgi:hypothetical protein
MKSKHPWLKDIDLNERSQEKLLVFNDKNIKRSQEQINNMFVEMKKRQMVTKYGKKPDVNLNNLEKKGVFKVDNDGLWELVAKCDNQKQAEEEIIWRAKEFEVIINKKTTLAQTAAPYRGTYVIFPIFEIK